MKRTLALLLSCLMLLPLLCGCSEEVVEDHFVKIGLFEPLSGDESQYGNWEKLGVEYARTVKQDAVINGVRHTVELVTADTRSRIDEAVYAARELADAGVSIVIGCYGDAACSVAAPELEKKNISAVGVSCTEPTVTLSHPNYCRVCYLDEYQAMLLADYAYEYGARLAYCMAQSDRAYDRAMCDAFIKEFKALGGNVITTVTTILYNTYTTNLNNFADYLYGAVTNKADVFFAPIPPKKGAQLIGECAAQNVRFSIIGDNNWDLPATGEAAANTYMYVSCASIFTEDQNETTKAFADGFREWLHADDRRLEANGGTDAINPASAQAYDAYMTAVAAIELASSEDSAEVGAALKNVELAGVTGAIAFDENGDLRRDNLIIKRADTHTGELLFEKTQQSRGAYVPPEPEK